MSAQLQANEGKALTITTENYGTFERYPIKTHVVMDGDDLKDILDTYVKSHLQEGDMIFISEKIVAITQGRAFPLEDIKPSRLATFLSKFVYKTPYGIGLGSPWTMELALRDVGRPRILFAAFCSAITKPFGKRGVFYKVAGTNARAIDGPCDYTLPPYDNYAKMAPKNPDKVAQTLSDYIEHEVAVMDANDLGVDVLGVSNQLDIKMCEEVFSDNPLGQTSEQTPIGIVRKIENA